MPICDTLAIAAAVALVAKATELQVAQPSKAIRTSNGSLTLTKDAR
jgi:hypothetical protein